MNPENQTPTKTTHRKTIAFDFDGVIHGYSRGWADGTCYDAPVPGAFDFIREMMKTHNVAVITTREVSLVGKYFAEHAPDIHFYEYAFYPHVFWNGLVVLITNRKIAAEHYIDDRAIRFCGNWEVMRSHVLTVPVKPWNEGCGVGLPEPAPVPGEIVDATFEVEERTLTPEAQADRDDFRAKYGDGDCSCHLSAPCNSCMHPGNPHNQEEDEHYVNTMYGVRDENRTMTRMEEELIKLGYLRVISSARELEPGDVLEKGDVYLLNGEWTPVPENLIGSKADGDFRFRRPVKVTDEEVQNSPRFRLWKFFHDEHKLTLLESELDDIIRAVQEHVPYIRDQQKEIEQLSKDRYAMQQERDKWRSAAASFCSAHVGRSFSRCPACAANELSQKCLDLMSSEHKLKTAIGQTIAFVESTSSDVESIRFLYDATNHSRPSFKPTVRKIIQGGVPDLPLNPSTEEIVAYVRAVGVYEKTHPCVTSRPSNEEVADTLLAVAEVIDARHLGLDLKGYYEQTAGIQPPAINLEATAPGGTGAKVPMDLRDKPLNERLDSETYHRIHADIGAASMCWNPAPSTEVFDSETASNIAFNLCHFVADKIEAARKKFPFPGWIFGNRIITFCNQPSGAPFIDECTTRTQDGRTFHGFAILLRPWSKNEYGTYPGGMALVLAKTTKPSPETTAGILGKAVAPQEEK